MTSISRTPFSAEQLVVIFGVIPISGYSDGTFLTITPNADLSNYSVGASGEINVNIQADNTSIAKIRVGRSNPTNQLLKAAGALFRTTGVFVPFAATDVLNPLETITSIKSNIVRFPDENYAVQAGDMYREFSILLHNTLRA